jgi:hypothetical protein
LTRRGSTFATFASSGVTLAATLLVADGELEEEHLARVLGPSASEGGDGDASLLPGIGPSPRLRRSLHTLSSSPPLTNAIDSTLSDPPLPSVPQWAKDDVVCAGTLNPAPHLFSIDTPFNVGLLRSLLASHPNQPLVESVLEGLTVGCWPGYVGDADSLNSLAPGPPPPILSDADHDFIAQQLLKDFEQGFLSEAFKELLAGMIVSGTFVVRIDGRKPRGVVDQTASGLNGGVPKEAAKVVYDTFTELGRLLRYAHSKGRLKFLLWKSDVSKAFRTLPVAKEWQVRQVHRARLRNRDGSYKTVYFVDQRVVFGGRLSPRLWCTVINVVLWGVQEHLKNENLFAYVDDVFSADFSDLLVPVVHPLTGECRLVPRDQARLLTAWTTLGVPWEWDKQLHGLSLVVLGHFVDGVALTVSLPHQAKVDFIAYIGDFLSEDAQPLFRWQRLAGYAQWACTTIPLARFALNSIYAKIAGKTRRNASIRLNVQVRKDLDWLATEFMSAPPLDLLDPALEEWRNGEVDVVAYTDACLESQGGLGSGLGFWYRRARAEHRSTFFSRISPSLDNIFLAETLAIASAVEHILKANISRRRILIFTDSALSVYAFDSERAQGPVSDIIKSAYELLRSYRVNLRVRHVAGTTNTTADRLSRDLPSSLVRAFPSLTTFSSVPKFSLATSPAAHSPGEGHQ